MRGEVPPRMIVRYTGLDDVDVNYLLLGIYASTKSKCREMHVESRYGQTDRQIDGKRDRERERGREREGERERERETDR